MSAEERLDNREGVLTANGNIKLDADNLTNHGGKISGAGRRSAHCAMGVNNSQGISSPAATSGYRLKILIIVDE